MKLRLPFRFGVITDDRGDAGGGARRDLARRRPQRHRRRGRDAGGRNGSTRIRPLRRRRISSNCARRSTSRSSLYRARGTRHAVRAVRRYLSRPAARAAPRCSSIRWWRATARRCSTAPIIDALGRITRPVLRRHDPRQCAGHRGDRADAGPRAASICRAFSRGLRPAPRSTCATPSAWSIRSPRPISRRASASMTACPRRSRRSRATTAAATTSSRSAATSRPISTG